MPMTYSFYNWKCVSFDPFIYFAHPYHLPEATTNLFSISIVQVLSLDFWFGYFRLRM